MGITPTPVCNYEPLPAGVIAAALSQALAQAAEYAGATAPNPPVGCVLLDVQGNTIAVAAHRKAGAPHAEAAAIALSRENGGFARIHTVVVTLEPCNHTGRTPPCTEAILSTPAQHLWIGAADPNPTVRGGGSQRLAAAGLTVKFIADLDVPEACDLASAAERLIAPFSKHARTGLPWVTVKQALDPASGMVPPAGRKTFTSEASLVFAHRLRKRADAILTGSGTILADDPLFTVRKVPDFTCKHRHLVILDRRARVPQTYVAAARARGFEVWLAQSLPHALRQLGDVGALEVLVEAGPQLTGAVLASELWDEHVLIRQNNNRSADDQITIRLRTAPTWAGKEADVFRHY